MRAGAASGVCPGRVQGSGQGQGCAVVLGLPGRFRNSIVWGVQDLKVLPLCLCSEVYIVLCGEHGLSGPRELYCPEQPLFERNSRHTFVLR